MKKLFHSILAVLLTVSLSGCSSLSQLTGDPLITNKEEIIEETNNDKVDVFEQPQEETQEEVKQEESQKEEVKEEISKQEPQKEEVKQEAPKKEEVKQETPKQEEPKKVEVKKEEPKVEVTFKDVNDTVYATTDVNVRKGPSTSTEKLGLLNYGKSVTRTGIGSNGWSRVTFDGKEAYINSAYLTTTKPAEQPVASTTSSYPLTYTDNTATITVYKEWYKNAWCYAAHIQFTDYTRFGTSCGNGTYGGYETTSHAGKRLGAILAINGCYSSPNLDYIVVRGGKIYNGADRSTWVPAIYSKYNGKLLSAWETGGTPGIAGANVTELVNAGLFTDSFNFGPPILSGGSVKGSGGGRAQRTFIGTNGAPGDIWLVVSDGRYNDGESAGLTYSEMASYLASKGCSFGVPLDGGGSSTMYFNGKVLNAARNGQRSVVDFVYFR